MKNKNIFDILENAEYDSMERLIDKCPLISNKQLDKIYVMSEKKFKKKKKELERTKKDNNKKMSGNYAVDGVERSRRPVWFTTLSTAASIILIAGVAIGSTIMIRGNKNNITPDTPLLPAVTASTIKATGTTNTVSSDKNGTNILTTFTTASETINSTAITTTVIAVEVITEASSDNEFIKPFVGKWTYQISDINNLNIESTIVNKGIVDIRSDATYTYTDGSGNVSTGKIQKAIEKIGSSELLKLVFSGDSFVSSDSYIFHSAYYTDIKPDELHFGNGYASRIVRGELTLNAQSNMSGWKTAYKNYLKAIREGSEYTSQLMWDLCDLDNDGTPELLISNGEYHAARVNYYHYYEPDGTTMFGCDSNGMIVDFGEYGEIMSCKEEGLIGWSNTHMGYNYTIMYKFTDRGLVKLQSTINNLGNVPNEEAEYKVNDESVSKDEHNKALELFNSKNWINAGRRYSFEDLSALN